MKLLKVCAVVLSVAAIILVARSQPYSSGNNDSNKDGRYRLVVTTGVIQTSSGSTPMDTQYVIDTQTGRVWRLAFDETLKLPVFFPYTYKNLEQQLSHIPNDNSTAVGFITGTTNK
jgi:hypothetical protein